MAQRIQVRRGLKANLPTLSIGELGFCTDTKELFVGSDSGNQLLAKKADIPEDSHSNKSTLEKITDDGVNLLFNGLPIGGATPSNVIFFEDWIKGDTVIIDTGNTTPPADTTPPNNVTNLTTSNVTATSLTLSWTASTSSDVSAYNIYKGTTLIQSVTGTSYSVSGLTANTSYTFTVKAKDNSNNISSGISVNVTTATSPAPADTTAPVLTITPASNFTDSQTVTMSVNESADIWYTTDGSDPVSSNTRAKYSSILTLTATTTVKAYAIDIAGNASAVQTLLYTKQSTGYQTGDTIFFDNFERADSSVLGNGWKQFSSPNGTHNLGIVGGKATFTEGTWTTGVNKFRRFTERTINHNNFSIEVDTTSPSGISAKMGIGIRLTSAGDMIYLTKSGEMGGVSSQYTITKVPYGGSATLMGSGIAKAKENDVIKIEHLSNGTIKVYINGVLDLTVTDTTWLTSSITVGLGCELNTTLFDNFKVIAL